LLPSVAATAETGRAARAARLRRLVVEAVARHDVDALILSGGLDTSILAHVAHARGLRRAFTVLVTPDAPDREHARAVATRLRLDHQVVDTDFEGVLSELPFAVRTLRTFDPMELRNSIVVARALRAAKDAGCRSAMTGDAADELFAGYSFLWDKPPEAFDASCRRMARIMRFSSVPMGRALGLDVRIPFMDPALVEFALGLEKDDKVNENDGVRHGKYLLRLAFPDLENRWRRKDPIEVGSGATRLPAYWAARIPADELAREQARVRRGEGVEIRDAEHLAYYRVFEEVFGKRPPLVRFGDDPCPKCGYELPTRESDFCVTCGAWPVR